VTSSVRSVELRKNPALLQILEPGDRIVAGMVASEGSWLLISTLVTLVLVLAFFLAAVITHDAHVYLPLLIASGVVSTAVQSRQKVYFVVITERELICHGLARFAWRLTRLLFTAPLPAAHVTVGAQTPLGKSVRYRGPGPQRQGLHLYVGNRSAGDLEEVLAALQTGGASVAGPTQA
jgi:hypothetical protein